MRLLAFLLLIWLVIGAVTAADRGYFNGSDRDCGSVGTIAVTVVVGPLNYVGVNPKVDCELPRPESR